MKAYGPSQREPIGHDETNTTYRIGRSHLIRWPEGRLLVHRDELGYYGFARHQHCTRAALQLCLYAERHRQPQDDVGRQLYQRGSDKSKAELYDRAAFCRTHGRDSLCQHPTDRKCDMTRHQTLFEGICWFMFGLLLMSIIGRLAYMYR
jgi:hypothetical protein